MGLSQKTVLLRQPLTSKEAGNRGVFPESNSGQHHRIENPSYILAIQ